MLKAGYDSKLPVIVCLMIKAFPVHEEGDRREKLAQNTYLHAKADQQILISLLYGGLGRLSVRLSDAFKEAFYLCVIVAGGSDHAILGYYLCSCVG